MHKEEDVKGKGKDGKGNSRKHSWRRGTGRPGWEAPYTLVRSLLEVVHRPSAPRTWINNLSVVSFGSLNTTRPARAIA